MLKISVLTCLFVAGCIGIILAGFTPLSVFFGVMNALFYGVNLAAFLTEGKR